MLQAFGNADALRLGTGRGEHFHILILLIGRVGGGGNLIQKIEVTGLNISVCRVQGRIEPEVDATVLRGEVALVIVVTNDLRALSMLPGNELIGTVANRLLAIRFRILIECFRNWQEADGTQLAGQCGVRRVQIDLERVVILDDQS